MFRKVIIFAIISLVLFEKYSNASQPAYQVSIWINTTYSDKLQDDIHICNGIIIHEALILTTATCVHFLDHISGQFRQIPSARLYITAGSTHINIYDDLLYRSVISIQIADGFNFETLDSDLAMLLLNVSLPLGNRLDMQWIIMDDNEHLYHTCLANVPSHNSKGFLTQKLSLVDNEKCNSVTSSPYSRNYDICSTYSSPTGTSCDMSSNFLNNNADRGTGFICNGRVVAVLSSILSPTNNTIECTQNSDYFTYYSMIGVHMNWIYGYMSSQEVRDMENPNLTLSAPYQPRNLNQSSLTTVEPTEIAPSPATNTTVTIELISNTTTPENLENTTNLVPNTTSWPKEIAPSPPTNTTVTIELISNATIPENLKNITNLVPNSTSWPLFNTTSNETETTLPLPTTPPTPSDKLVDGSSNGHSILFTKWLLIILFSLLVLK